MAATLRDSALVQMMTSGQYSDMSISCMGEIFKVHKAVVVGQSAVIRAAAEGNFKEALTNNIALDGYPPAVVKRLVQFLYTSNYDDPDSSFDGRGESAPAADGDTNASNEEPTQPQPSQIATAAEHIEGHIRMNGIGDYLQMEELATLSKDKLKGLVHHENPDQSWVTHLPALCRAAAQLTADKTILEIMTSCFAENLAILIKLSSFKESDMMTDFALMVLSRVSDITQSLGEDLAATQKRLTSSNGFLFQIRIKEAKLEKAISLLNTTTKCRNTSCSMAFGCHIDNADYALRCNYCKCRHTPAPAAKEAK